MSKLCDVHIIRRKGPNKVKTEIKDILNLFENADNDNLNLPKCVADNFNSLPPISGFECVARRIVTLTEEIEALKSELAIFRDNNDNYKKGMEDCINIKMDIADIKTMLVKAQKNADELATRAKSTKCFKNDSMPADFLRPFIASNEKGTGELPQGNNAVNNNTVHTDKCSSTDLLSEDFLRPFGAPIEKQINQLSYYANALN